MPTNPFRRWVIDIVMLLVLAVLLVILGNKMAQAFPDDQVWWVIVIFVGMSMTLTLGGRLGWMAAVMLAFLVCMYVFALIGANNNALMMGTLCMAAYTGTAAGIVVTGERTLTPLYA